MTDAIRADGVSSPKPSPLVRVLAQIRWPVMSNFSLDGIADDLAIRIGKDYPFRERAQEIGFLLTPEGVTPQPGGALHRFIDPDRQWTVTIAATFVTLETTAYVSHDDFIPRLVAVAREVRDFLPLQRWERFGYRYTNRFSDEADLNDLTRLFESGVLGALALNFDDTTLHSIGETVYQGADASLLVKTAYLPPNGSIEATIPPVVGPSWLLDLDAFVEGPSSAFSDDEIALQANVLAQKAHAFFEKVVKDEYRSRFAI